MTKAEKIGIGAGLAGTILGSTVWMIILGVAQGDWVLVLAPLAVGILCCATGVWLLQVCPGRYVGTFGLIGLWLVMLNGILANAYYDRIPESLGGISTGKSPWALLQVNFFIVALGLIASFCIIREFLKDK